MQTVLKDIPDNRLRLYVVWLPMFPGDSRSWAQTRSDEFTDGRVSYYWDKDRLSGQQWRTTLGLDKNAWDVYLLYGPESQWDKGIPTASFWMHQMSGVTKAPQLNKNEFEAKVRQSLSTAK
ncbi:MAG TPA: hypothetical protein VFC63_18420 [Blastocatellia bacterium]|nr:hypothetical protein [Blastocatellia bacterium]